MNDITFIKRKTAGSWKHEERDNDPELYSQRNKMRLKSGSSISKEGNLIRMTGRLKRQREKVAGSETTEVSSKKQTKVIPTENIRRRNYRAKCK